VERGIQSVEVDGLAAEGGAIQLADDKRRHEVRIVLGKEAG
jgi:hypothetical protein